MTDSVMAERLRIARIRSSNAFPYLSSALFSMTMVESDRVPTMGVDRGWRLYYRPDWCQTLDDEQLAFVMTHEVWHLLRAHEDRNNAISADANIFNVAGDCEINDDLLGHRGIKFPPDGQLPKNWNMDDGLMAEEYYDLLMQKAVDCPGKCGCRTIYAPGHEKDGNCGQCPGDGTPCTSHPGDCGSGAHGESRPWEQAPKDANGNDTGVSRGNAELIRQETAKKISEESSRQRGTVPAGWEIWAQRYLTPIVDWRKELAAQIKHALAETRSGMTDYSFKRPGRRQSAFRDIVIPTMRSPIPRIAIVVDTSGSMGGERIERAMAEIGGILRSSGITTGVPVISVDAAVHSAKKVFAKSQVQLAGGGGTDMRVGISAAEDLRPIPHVIVLLTDAETPWPDVAPKARFVVGVVGNKDCPVPTYARRVDIDL